MKVELKASGVLVIAAESELEAYALSRWGEDNFSMETGTLPSESIIIDHSFPVVYTVDSV